MASAFRLGPEELALESICFSGSEVSAPSAVLDSLTDERWPEMTLVRIANGARCGSHGDAFDAVDVPKIQIRVVDHEVFRRGAADPEAGRERHVDLRGAGVR